MKIRYSYSGKAKELILPTLSCIQERRSKTTVTGKLQSVYPRPLQIPALKCANLMELCEKHVILSQFVNEYGSFRGNSEIPDTLAETDLEDQRPIQRSNQTNTSHKSTVAHVDEVRQEFSTEAHPRRENNQICEEVYKEPTTGHEDGRDTVELPSTNAAENPRTPGLRGTSRFQQPEIKLYGNQEQHPPDWDT
ncbi:hypothetical protein JTB14_004264 [Gonioctena quinquepunctata]|nr:hypothetical protein JTB14_004264 [Gonioctena quinquepunctata]